MIHIVCALLEQTGLYLPLLLGAYCVFSLLQIPFLALENAYTFGALCASTCLTLTLSPVLSGILTFCAALFGGAFVGIIAYVIKQHTQVSFLLASIIIRGLFHGINQFILQGSHISVHPRYPILSFLPSLYEYPQLSTLLFFALILSIIFFYFTRSSLGMSCALYGNNHHFFEHYGISTHYIVFIGICLSSALAGLSGFLVATINGFADISMGFGVNLLSIIMLILGKSIIAKKYTLAIPLIGLISYLLIQQLLLKIHFNSQYFTMVQSLIICIILYISQTLAKGKQYELGL